MNSRLEFSYRFLFEATIPSQHILDEGIRRVEFVEKECL
jgi:hypothetical protein